MSTAPTQCRTDTTTRLCCLCAWASVCLWGNMEMLIWVVFTISEDGIGSLGHAAVDKRAPEYAGLCIQISLLQAFRSQHLVFRFKDRNNSPLPRPL